MKPVRLTWPWQVLIWIGVFFVVLTIVKTSAFQAFRVYLETPYGLGALFLAWIVWFELGERLMIRNMRRKRRYTEAEMPEQLRLLHGSMSLVFAIAAVVFAGLLALRWIRVGLAPDDYVPYLVGALVVYCAVEAGVQWRRYRRAAQLEPPPVG